MPDDDIDLTELTESPVRQIEAEEFTPDVPTVPSTVTRSASKLRAKTLKALAQEP